MPKLATIALPIYRRLNYLPQLLTDLAKQEYPDIELLVSDNGENGDKVRQLVQTYYPRPFTFRQNPKTVPLTAHFNQLVQVARGEYFVVLADDDEISTNFVSELAALFERYPKAAAGFSRQDFMNERGELVGGSKEPMPEMMSGGDFVEATWLKYQFGFHSVSSFLGKTELMRAGGGYPDIPTGTHIDDALIIRMVLGRQVVFSSKAAYRIRIYETSHGFSIRVRQLAAACRAFLRFLDTDRTLQEFAAAHPEEWRRMRGFLREMSWQTYLGRWSTMYRRRMSYADWVAAAFVLPLIPAYYKKVGRTLLEDLRSRRVERQDQPRAEAQGHA